MAGDLIRRIGNEPGPVIVIMPLSADAIIATLALWWARKIIVHVNPECGADEWENLRLLLGKIPVVRGVETAATIEVDNSAVQPTSTARPAVALAGGEHAPLSAALTGGTTGIPRIVMREPWTYESPSVLSPLEVEGGLRLGQTQLLTLPLYHGGFNPAFGGIAAGHTIVMVPRFDPAAVASAFERYSVNYAWTVPFYMALLLRSGRLSEKALENVESIHHGSAPCPGWVKEGWIDLVGGDRLFEDYSCVERIGVVSITGTEWLDHRSSVGKPKFTDVRIVDAEGLDVPAGVVGEVMMRSPWTKQPKYLGGGPKLREVAGFLGIGDLGYMSAAGYLYLVDRISNVISVGGTDVWPSEVEATLLGHPDIADAIVVGRPHPYLGKTIHAILVRAENSDLTSLTVRRYCSSRLAPVKIPRTIEWRDTLERPSSGKVARAKFLRD